MKSVVRPELSTAAAGPSQAPTAAVDNSAPRSTHPEPTYKSGKTVQLTGTTYSCRGHNSDRHPDHSRARHRIDPLIRRLDRGRCRNDRRKCDRWKHGNE